MQSKQTVNYYIDLINNNNKGLKDQIQEYAIKNAARDKDAHKLRKNIFMKFHKELKINDEDLKESILNGILYSKIPEVKDTVSQIETINHTKHAVRIIGLGSSGFGSASSTAAAAGGVRNNPAGMMCACVQTPTIRPGK